TCPKYWGWTTKRTYKHTKKTRRGKTDWLKFLQIKVSRKAARAQRTKGRIKAVVFFLLFSLWRCGFA
ncbi:MAG TPA: hypothetical protein PK012_34730, partial [Blastocatellia bacterium]|nr:hypothetical protein [Blastocatellia bacterium]